MFNPRVVANKIIEVIELGGTVFIGGNGGSACEASHFSGELVGKFRKERRALPCFDLTAHTSAITAIANDYGYDFVFSRQLEAFAKKGDMLITLSTSGKSLNVLQAIHTAKSIGMYHYPFPTNIECGTETYVTQNYHLELVHQICEMVEDHFV